MQTSLTCKVQLLLEIPGKEAQAVRRALEPDNVDFPEGLSLHIAESEPGLLLCFEGDKMLQLASTVDEVMGHIQAALGAIR
ncbi:MAG: hypothetical protein EB829_01175 [Nitrosopumilus sp. H8]|nr:MAG: hypothetical protein EB830_03375 [Nitrosopumilus sp. H13]RNJ79930.1 MAG: hypothetical protein EB829_01175 [Nitrosopumilus sp. H8]